MANQQRIENREITFSIVNKVKTVFVPQFRRLFLWGALKGRWQDYAYNYGDDMLMGLSPTSYQFDTKDGAVHFLLLNV